MSELTKLQSDVLAVISRSGTIGASPTEIGKALGLPYHSASSRMNAPIKKLVSLGLVERFSGRSIHGFKGVRYRTPTNTEGEG